MVLGQAIQDALIDGRWGREVPGVGARILEQGAELPELEAEQASRRLGAPVMVLALGHRSAAGAVARREAACLIGDFLAEAGVGLDVVMAVDRFEPVAAVGFIPDQPVAVQAAQGHQYDYFFHDCRIAPGAGVDFHA